MIKKSVAHQQLNSKDLSEYRYSALRTLPTKVRLNKNVHAQTIPTLINPARARHFIAAWGGLNSNIASRDAPPPMPTHSLRPRSFFTLMTIVYAHVSFLFSPCVPADLYPDTGDQPVTLFFFFFQRLRDPHMFSVSFEDVHWDPAAPAKATAPPNDLDFNVPVDFGSFVMDPTDFAFPEVSDLLQFERY